MFLRHQSETATTEEVPEHIVGSDWSTEEKWAGPKGSAQPEYYYVNLKEDVDLEPRYVLVLIQTELRSGVKHLLIKYYHDEALRWRTWTGFSPTPMTPCGGRGSYSALWVKT